MKLIAFLSLYLVFFISQTTAKVEFLDVWNFCDAKPDYLSTGIDVKVKDCKESPCEFVRGTNVSMIITFTPTVDTTGLYIKLYGKMGPITIPSGPTKSVCHLAPPCEEKPGLYSNTEYKLMYPYPILKTYPKLTVTAKVKLMNPQEQTLLCVEIPLTIIDEIDRKSKITRKESVISHSESSAATSSSSLSTTTTFYAPSSTPSDEEELSTEWDMVSRAEYAPKIDKSQASIMSEDESSSGRKGVILCVFTVLIASILSLAL